MLKLVKTKGTPRLLLRTPFAVLIKLSYSEHRGEEANTSPLPVQMLQSSTR